MNLWPRLFSVCAGVVLGLVIASPVSSVVSIKAKTTLQFPQGALFAGHDRGAHYIVDSGFITQYNAQDVIKARIALPEGNAENAVFSQDGGFFALRDSGLVIPDSVTGEEEKPAGISHKSSRIWKIYDRTQKERARIPSTTNTKLYLSDDGYFVSVRLSGKLKDKSVIILYDSVGAEITSFVTEKAHGIVFAPKGEGFLLDLEMNGSEWRSRTGARIVAIPQPIEFAFSLSGRKLVTYLSDTLTIYRGATIEKTFPLHAPVTRKIIFDDYRRRIFVMTYRWIYMVSAENGSVGLNYFAPTDGSEFTDLDYSPDKAYLAVGIQPPLQKDGAGKFIMRITCAVRVLTPEGIELPMHHIPGMGYREGHPQVQFSAEGYSVLVIAHNQIQRISWPR